MSVIPPYEFRLDIAKKVASLTFVYVMMLAFNNLCLQFVEVTFYQVARSLTIVFNIVFTYIILGTTTNQETIFACAIVTAGFGLGSYGEINFSWAGLLFGVGSSVFVALYGIYVKKSLAVVENDQWRLLHYNTTIAIIMLFPLVVMSGELSDMMDEVTFWDDMTCVKMAKAELSNSRDIRLIAYHNLRARPSHIGDTNTFTAPTRHTSPFSFWSVMTLTGLTGFLINITTFLQIKYTSPLTNTISGTAKACAQTIIAAAVYRNPISLLVSGVRVWLEEGTVLGSLFDMSAVLFTVFSMQNGVGIMLSLAGSAFYSYVRYKEMIARR
ncbi:hypothetical protein HDU93_006406 [Gonapodya sp. JEL0774]|nr:hypothetical protein HDU93_006406 [Gonapodya sp. JEL0774]